MFNMDLKSKGITWVGNMYQKLETMCREVCQDVESIMNQEPSIYVESQVQTVGVNVQKFCNEVMQDLLSPSALSVKGPITDSSLMCDVDVGICKKSKIDTEECPVSEKPLSSTELGAFISVGKDLKPRSLADESHDVNHGESCDTLINKSVSNLVEVSAHTFPENMEPSKYVESQEQIVGVNIQKFCNEVMQNLLSPSALSLTGPISEFSLMYDVEAGLCKRSKIDTEEHPVSEKLLSSTELEEIISAGKDLKAKSLADESHDVNHGEFSDTLIDKSIPISVEVSGLTFPEIVGENHDKVSDVAANVTDLPSVFTSESVVPVISHEKKGICTPCETMPLVRTTEIGHDQLKKTIVLEDSLPIPETVGKGRSDDCDLSEASEDDNTSGPGNEIIEKFEDVKLEESFVDIEKNELCFISYRASKNRSYKKKIRDAFASKLRPAKKHDDEQIAIWFGDIDMETKRRGGVSTSSSIIEHLESTTLSNHDSYESDWELL
ncbi:uncharacterized protein LOC143860668 [Tasmannia lanceolata]|uniref:uncharacterized protein LOC143860668 n=1 Tax=Tasmannia lanceolata TaxID=3420 RepID=UPI0040637E2A